MARHVNQVARQIDDLHRLTHVEHQHLAALANHRRLQHQACGFGDGHEVTNDVGVRHGDGPTARNLLFEFGDHAAAAAQHIAKTHGHEPRAAMRLRERGDDHLGRPLGCTHDIGRVDSLVGADEHKALCPAFAGSQGRVVGAQGVVAQCRLCVMVFHQGHMFVGCSMENNLGPPPAQVMAQNRQVFDVTDQTHQGQRWEALAQLLFNAVEVELALLQQHQARRVPARHLAAKFTANAAACPRHEHGLARQRVPNAGFVQLHRFAPQQVVGFDLAQPLDAALAFAQLVHRGHGEHVQTRAPGQLERAAALRGAGAWQGDDDVGGTTAQRRVTHGGQLTQHGHTRNSRTAFGGVVVKQTQHHPALLVDARQQQAGGGARPHHQRTARLSSVPADARAHMLVKHAVGNAHHAHRHQRHHGVQRQHGARHFAQAQAHDHNTRHAAGQQTCPCQTFNFSKARKPPHALWHFHQHKGQQVQTDDAAHDPQVVAGSCADPALKTQAE